MTSLFANANLTAAEFLRDYWQTKPLLLRQAFPGFEPELDPDDIAGLACDELAESRLVTGRHPEGPWTVRYGPFEEADFADLPERDWTLLVQDVEKHYPPLRALLSHFDFLPSWRIDDLMASVAAPGGSVGPHVDQYDVFLLQASGRRRWQIAQRFDPALLAGCELNVLRHFEPEQEWLLEPGDLLYLPPGVAHFGVAEDCPRETPPCMTWSIGMRAPSAADLLQSYAEWLTEAGDEGGRYRDPDLAAPPDPARIDPHAIERLQGLARSALDRADRWPRFLGAFLSSYRLALQPAPPERALQPGELRDLLQAGGRLLPHPWTRLLWLPREGGAWLFAAGAEWACAEQIARAVCDPAGLDAARVPELEAAQDLLCALVNRGHLVVETV